MLTSLEAFDAWAESWDALVDRCNDEVFHRHGFIRLWLQNFAAKAELRVLILLDNGNAITAALPLILVRSRLFWVPVRELQAAANMHSCRFDMLADDPAKAAREFIAYLQACRDWDLLRLIDTPADGAAVALLAAAERIGMTAGCWTSQDSPYTRLPATVEAFEAMLHRRFRSNLRRRLRCLQAHGTVTTERCSGGPQLASKLAEGFALEASGWKGRAGTAILQDPATHAFYQSLAEQAANQGRLALWFLRVDGRAVAFDYALEHQGRLSLLKTAYDEQFADCSPGQLLLERELHDAIRRGLQICDFLGPSTAAKRVWTRLSRPHCWIFLFRGARGRVVHGLKFRVLPLLKRLMPNARRARAVRGGDARAQEST